MSAMLPEVGDRGFQSIDQLGKGRVVSGWGARPVEPLAAFAEIAVGAILQGCVEIAVVVTIREIDIAFDVPARVFEEL